MVMKHRRQDLLTHTRTHARTTVVSNGRRVRLESTLSVWVNAPHMRGWKISTGKMQMLALFFSSIDPVIVACDLSWPLQRWRRMSDRPAGSRQAAEEIVDDHALPNAGLGAVGRLERPAVVEILAVMPPV